MTNQRRKPVSDSVPPIGQGRIWFVRWGMTHWFPELQRFSTKAKQKAAWQVALYDASGPWQWNTLGIALTCAGMYLGLFVAPALLTQAVGSPTLRAVAIPVALILALSIPLVMTIAIFRRNIQASLRRQLQRQQHPTCMKCGYDLTGNESGVCPECGDKI